MERSGKKGNEAGALSGSGWLSAGGHPARRGGGNDHGRHVG